MSGLGVSPNRISPKFPTIPVPEANVESLHRTALALKQAVEMLTGSDPKSRSGDQANRYAPHVFVQATTPQALHEGDLWLCEGPTFTFNIWRTGGWMVIATLPPV